MKQGIQARFCQPQNADGAWHNGADVELHLYAGSLQRAAKLLIQKADGEEDTTATWDAAPILLLYRQAVELGLKALVGEGAVFLKRPTDHITLYKTHSLPSVAQIACQIIDAFEWETNSNVRGFQA